MSSNDRGDEPEVTKPPVPRSRPGRPASSARRATDDTGPRPAVPRRAPNRSASTTTVDPPAVDPALDDTVETERPTVMPPDPLLRAKVADGRANGNGKGHTNGNGNTNGNGHTTGNGNGHGTRSGNGSKANGSTRNGTTPRAKAGSRAGDRGPQSGRAPIEAAAVETAEARAVPASEPQIVGMPPAPAVEPPSVEPTEPGAPTVVDAPPAPVERDLPPPTVATTNAVVDVSDSGELSDLGALGDPPVVAAVAPTMPPPSPLASPVLDPSTLKSKAAAADTFDMSSQPFVDLPVVGQPDAEASPPSNGAASRWSLRTLLSKLSTTRSIPGTDVGPPSAAELDASAAGTEPMARSSTSPITSPIPVQPPATISDAPAAGNPEAAQAFVMPFGLMPEQPPYIRPAPSFPGMFRTGPVELDPSLDPDLPQRAPRLKPVQITALRRRGRPRMRRVTRVVRHVDPWSVFKVALCFSLVLYGVCLTAGVLLWNVAYTTGTIDNVQRFFESFGWDTFRFKGGELYHNAWIAGLFCAIGLTGLIVLAATLFNLITDLVGGIRVTVLEEEVIERDPAERRTLLRRRSRHTTSTVSAHGHREEEEPIELYEHLG